MISEGMDPKDRQYSNDDITVYWKPGKCVHATTCYRELIEVFNPRKRPWVDMKGAPTQRIIEVVDKCPTQALSWKWNNAPETSAEPKTREAQTQQTLPEEQPVWVQVMRDGPVVVQGKFKVYDGEGKN